MKDKEAITPDSFRFFRTFYEASKMIGDDKSRLRFYDTISEYVFLNELPSFLNDTSIEGRMLNMAWLLVKPVVDKSIGNSMGGRNSAGERPCMSGNNNAQKQHENNSQSTVEQQSINRDKEKDKEKEYGVLVDESTRQKTMKFIKPTIEEIREYCSDRGNSVDAEKFHSYYEANGWKVGKNPMKDWRAAVRTWEKSQQGSAIPQQQPQRKHKVTTNINDLSI